MDKIPNVTTDAGGGYLFIPVAERFPPPATARFVFDDSSLEGKEAKGDSGFFAKEQGPLSNIAATSDSHARSKKLVKLERATLKKKQQALVHLHGDEAAGNRLAGLFAKKHRKEFSCTWMIQSKNPQLLLLSYQQLAHRLEIQFDPMDPLEWLLGIVHKSIDRLPLLPSSFLWAQIKSPLCLTVELFYLSRRINST